MKGLVHLWNTWGIETLVLASFTLQLFLLIFGGIRRRSSSTMLRVSLWLAYLLADSTAIYALGRLSIVSRSGEHQLVAFWAPFLLLHLGGPDNITAYALEDNSLWLRHLQTLVVQVLGAAYVIYKYMSGIGILLLLATISMFVAGLVKYGERIWALKCGSMSSIRDRFNKWDHNVNLVRFGMEGKSEDEILLEAHYRFGICKSVFFDITLGTGDVDFFGGRINVGQDIYKLVEMELSLMYDILYTKAAVIHTWYGFCIHLISLLGTATAFLLFQLSIRGRGDGHPYSRADVIISYVLLVGAMVLEAISVCRAVFSTWTCSFVYSRAQRGSMDTLGWLTWLLHVVASLRRPFQPASRRLWRDSVGQYNLFHLCTRDTTEPWSRLATKMGFEDWWNKLHFKGTFSGTDSLSTHDLRELVLQALPLSDIDATHTNLSSRGRMILENTRAYRDFAQWSVGIDFDQSILVWHIATDLFIQESNTDHESQDFRKLVEATKVLSNYMMFLLVAKPDMLPGHVRHNLFVSMCTNLEFNWTQTRARRNNPGMGSHRSWNPCHMLKELFHNDGPNCSRTQQRQDLAEELFLAYQNELESITSGNTLDPRSRPFDESGHTCAVLLAKELHNLGTSDTLQLIFGVWVEMMLYAAHHCSRDSHARQLSNGGEFMTIVWILVYHQMYIERYNAFVDLIPSPDV